MNRTIGVVVAVLALSLVSPVVARGVTLDTIAVPGAAATNGVAVGGDGTAWVAAAVDGATGSLARIAPDNTVTQTPLAGTPTSVALVGGKAWVTLTSRHEIAVVDPAAPAAATTIALGDMHCGPVGIADGGNGKAYVSLPQDGSGATCLPNAPSEIAVLDVAARSVTTYLAGKGTAYDLLAANGALYVPDRTGDVVRRLTLDAANTLPPTATYAASAGAGVQGVTAGVDGALLVTYFDAGSLARTPLAAGSGDLGVFATQLAQPVGAAPLGQALYVAASAIVGGTPAIVRIPAAGAPSPIAVPAGAQPWDAASGNNTAFVTDLAGGRVFRLTSRAPQAVTGDAAVSSSGVAVVGTVDPGGNATTVQVEYGPTTAYGTTVSLPAVDGVGARAVSAAIPGLAAGTTYHYRVVAANEEGAAQGADRTFATSPSPGPAPMPTPAAPGRLRAKVVVSARVRGRRTTVRRLRVSGLLGGETITATCKGRGCPAKRKARTVRTTVRKAGAVTLSRRLTRKPLRAGATLSIRISRPGSRTTRVVVAIRKNRKPKVTTRR